MGRGGIDRTAAVNERKVLALSEALDQVRVERTERLPGLTGHVRRHGRVEVAEVDDFAVRRTGGADESAAGVPFDGGNVIRANQRVRQLAAVIRAPVTALRIVTLILS